jgi:glutaminyl-peptide cyclotransferase
VIRPTACEETVVLSGAAGRGLIPGIDGSKWSRALAPEACFRRGLFSCPLPYPVPYPVFATSRGPQRQVLVAGVVGRKGGIARQPTFRLSHLARAAARFALLILLTPAVLSAQHFNGSKALDYTREFVAIGPRWPTSQGHAKAEVYLRAKLQHDQLEEDAFTADTPIGTVPLRNFIVRFPGKKPGAIVLATHYETNYPLRTINFVGANDGGATTGLLMALADQFRQETAGGKLLDGFSVWLVFFDGEEAFQTWSQSDSTYGSRHLAAKWGRDGTLGKIKAFLLADMIGDKDLDIQRESNSTQWLVELVKQAAHKFGYDRYFFQKDEEVEDDHLPFVKRGVPSIDIIDLDYGPNNSYHHTAQDTLDKVSARSLTIDGDVFLETIRLINQR